MTSWCYGKLLTSRTPVQLQFLRHKWITKIKVNVYPSLQERLAEKDEALRDPELHAPVNIGFSTAKRSRREKLYSQIEKSKALKQDETLERLARLKLLKVDLDDVQEQWTTTGAPAQTFVLAKHYKIFQDLFGNAFFVPHVYLNVFYNYNEELVSVVHRGNVIKPAEYISGWLKEVYSTQILHVENQIDFTYDSVAANTPSIQFESKPEDLWTLVMTNPDGNLYDSEYEVLHWFV
ncbi:39S ribosomal protein L38, mitochondrial [Halocaridina rubra]|uniref:39S ribosomal protein L38, mitochondrial n=1 Tax=Halocaridina rubra TaxID=373956 RepID=A0AAN8XGC3_HALRR